MIKTIVFALVVLVVLIVPTFSITDAQASPVVVIGKDNTVKSMAYAGTQQGKNPDFAITPENVVPVDVNGKLTLMSPEGKQFTAAKILDVNQKTVNIPVINNQITFATSGVFTLTVIAGANAYVCIVVVGEQEDQVVFEQISNTYIWIEISIITIFEPAPPDIPCPPGYRTDDNQTDVCVPIPELPIVNNTTPIPNATSPSPSPNATDPTPGPNATAPIFSNGNGNGNGNDTGTPIPTPCPTPPCDGIPHVTPIPSPPSPSAPIGLLPPPDPTSEPDPSPDPEPIPDPDPEPEPDPEPDNPPDDNDNGGGDENGESSNGNNGDDNSNGDSQFG